MLSIALAKVSKNDPVVVVAEGEVECILGWREECAHNIIDILEHRYKSYERGKRQ
jgi:hypothetical protein